MCTCFVNPGRGPSTPLDRATGPKYDSIDNPVTMTCEPSESASQCVAVRPRAVSLSWDCRQIPAADTVTGLAHESAPQRRRSAPEAKFFLVNPSRKLPVVDEEMEPYQVLIRCHTKGTANCVVCQYAVLTPAPMPMSTGDSRWPS